MSPNVLKVAMAFGGSMNFDNREGIARFGMGMKTAALSMAPVFELYSWQERTAIYSMVLDVEEIGKERANLVQLPGPDSPLRTPGRGCRCLTQADVVAGCSGSGFVRAEGGELG